MIGLPARPGPERILQYVKRNPALPRELPIGLSTAPGDCPLGGLSYPDKAIRLPLADFQTGINLVAAGDRSIKVTLTP